MSMKAQNVLGALRDIDEKNRNEKLKVDAAKKKENDIFLNISFLVVRYRMNVGITSQLV